MASNFSQLRFCLLFPLVVLLTTIFSVPSDAFHNGGVGYCEGCHALHKPGENPFDAGGQNPYLLISSDPGSVCLTCHMDARNNVPTDYRVATADSDIPNGTAPVQLTPGGDFGWLKKRYRWGSGNGDAVYESKGERHGHNIIAADYQFVPDSTLTSAPGGTYPSDGLSCISCHDPHGKYRRLEDGSIRTSGLPVVDSGSYATSSDPVPKFAVGVYRLLGGKGYSIASVKIESFTFDPPAAVSPLDPNRAEDGADTRVAYGSGMSEWCANCHRNMLGSNNNANSHPAGNTVRMTTETIANYNAYIASGNFSGTRASSYTSMVPFEMGTSDYSVLKRTANKDGAVMSGPDGNSNVMCLSCHRAHASGWDHGARWNLKVDTLVYNGQFPGTDDSTIPASISQGRTRAETRKAYYDRPPTAYATYQRSLCNKCHAKD